MIAIPADDPNEPARAAAERLRELTGVARHDLALVMGSGWLPAVDALGEATAEIDTTDLPGFSAAAVAGHSGKIRSIRNGDKNLLVFLSSDQAAYITGTMIDISGGKFATQMPWIAHRTP